MMKRISLPALALVVSSTALADYKPQTVTLPVPPDLVIAVDNHASMTYDWCGTAERNQVYGDGDSDPRLRGGRTLCSLGQGRSRLQHLRTALREQFQSMEGLRVSLLRPGQNNSMRQLAEADNYRYPAGINGARQSLPMWGPDGSNSVCDRDNQCCWGDRYSDFNRRQVRQNFISVDSQSIEDGRSELLSWVDAAGSNELRALGASNFQGMLMGARYVHRRNATGGANSVEACRRHMTMVITDSWDRRGGNVCATANNSLSNINDTISGNRSRSLGNAASDTLVVGFGPHYASASNRDDLDALARRGGLAMHPTMPYVVNNNVGRALYARTPEELRSVLEGAVQTIFSGEYQGGRAEVTTLWNEASDVGRVVDNGMLVPIVQQPGNRGRLYAFRLFHEEGAYSGEWTFQGDPTIRWDAGALLANRTSYHDRSGAASNRKPRQIYTAVAKREVEGATSWSTGKLKRLPLSWPIPRAERMQVYRSFDLRCPMGAANSASCWDIPDLNENGNSGDDYDRRIAMSRMIMKLRGARIDTTQPDAKIGDEIVDNRHGFMDEDGVWKLGPLVHSSPTTPRFGRNTGRQETDPSYKRYAGIVGGGPPMAYVGAGHMIHAFFLNTSAVDNYAPDDVAHEAGEEAWAYLPRSTHGHLRNVMAKDFAAFNSDTPSLMDGRCRAIEAKLDLPQASERGGWSALIICPAVKARSVIVLDVTEPLNPLPVMEFADSYLGEVVSTPAVGFVDDGRGNPKAVMFVASGIGNGKLGRSAGCSEAWCSDIPAVLIVDLASGDILRRLTVRGLVGEGIMADVTVLDHDGDGLLDLGYVGTTGGRLLTLNLRARGQPNGGAFELTERSGVDNAMGGMAQIGGPVVDMRELNAPRFNMVLSAAAVGAAARPNRRGLMRVMQERNPSSPGGSSLASGCTLTSARGARLGPLEYPVGSPVVSKGTAIYTTVQGGNECTGAIQRMRCVDLDTCTETCNEILCDPRQQTCSAEPAPPPFLADGRLYAYDPNAGRLRALARVGGDGVEVAGQDGLADNGSPEAQPNQRQPKNLIMHWREVY